MLLINLILSTAKKNIDPEFENAEKWNFRAKENAPLIDAGLNVPIGNDLDDMPRIQGSSIDIGCYEFQP